VELPDRVNRKRVRRTSEAGNAGPPKLFKDAFVAGRPTPTGITLLPKRWRGYSGEGMGAIDFPQISISEKY